MNGVKVPRRPQGRQRRPIVPQGRSTAMRREPLDPRTKPVLRGRPARSRIGEQIDCLWLSRIGGRTVGMVRLVGAGDQAVRLSLFHVDPEWQHTAIVTNLVQYVHDFCCERRCGTLQLAPQVAPQWVPQLINGRGFRLLRRTAASGQDVFEFAVDPDYQRAKHVDGAAEN